MAKTFIKVLFMLCVAYCSFHHSQKMRIFHDQMIRQEIAYLKWRWPGRLIFGSLKLFELRLHSSDADIYTI